MLWFGLKNRIVLLEYEVKRLRNIELGLASVWVEMQDEIKALKEDNERLLAVKEYWRNRACHKKQKSNRKAILETARRMQKG